MSKRHLSITMYLNTAACRTLKLSSGLSKFFSSLMESAQPSYLIVGAGIFGASTALHLKAAEPKAQVTLIDRTPYPCPYGASFDLNKIVRDYYADKFYMRLANEAQQICTETNGCPSSNKSKFPPERRSAATSTGLWT